MMQKDKQIQGLEERVSNAMEKIKEWEAWHAENMQEEEADEYEEDEEDALFEEESAASGNSKGVKGLLDSSSEETIKSKSKEKQLLDEEDRLSDVD